MSTNDRRTETGRPDKPRSLARKLAWFAALWLAGLLVTAGVAYSLRALLFAA